PGVEHLREHFAMGLLGQPAQAALCGLQGLALGAESRVPQARATRRTIVAPPAAVARIAPAAPVAPIGAAAFGTPRAAIAAAVARGCRLGLARARTVVPTHGHHLARRRGG